MFEWIDHISGWVGILMFLFPAVTGPSLVKHASRSGHLLIPALIVTLSIWSGLTLIGITWAVAALDSVFSLVHKLVSSGAISYVICGVGFGLLVAPIRIAGLVSRRKAELYISTPKQCQTTELSNENGVRIMFSWIASASVCLIALGGLYFSAKHEMVHFKPIFGTTSYRPFVLVGLIALLSYGLQKFRSDFISAPGVNPEIGGWQFAAMGGVAGLSLALLDNGRTLLAMLAYYAASCLTLAVLNAPSPELEVEREPT